MRVQSCPAGKVGWLTLTGQGRGRHMAAPRKTMKARMVRWAALAVRQLPVGLLKALAQRCPAEDGGGSPLAAAQW